MRALIILFALAACTSIDDPVPVCVVHFKQWAALEQRLILSAEQGLPEDSILITALQDYANMRVEAKSCLDHHE